MAEAKILNTENLLLIDWMKRPPTSAKTTKGNIVVRTTKIPALRDNLKT